jgi:hypothetical protein
LTELTEALLYALTMSRLGVRYFADDLRSPWVSHPPGKDRVHGSGLDLATPGVEQPRYRVVGRWC